MTLIVFKQFFPKNKINDIKKYFKNSEFDTSIFKCDLYNEDDDTELYYYISIYYSNWNNQCGFEKFFDDFNERFKIRLDKIGCIVQ